MIAISDVEKSLIQRHYDVSTVFYRLLWGPHIHHGLWETGRESSAAAQLQLTDRLASLAGVKAGWRVLDVGCGMGGSTIRLARRYRCQVTGVTLSPLQRSWARLSSYFHGVPGRARFLRQDAEALEVEPESLDLVWSIECTEHLFDKAGFFERAARWLKPGGRMAICAWLAGQTDGDPQRQQQVRDVCEGFLCPSLGTMQDYADWMATAGLEVQSQLDWTEQVTRTWEICRRRVTRCGVHRLAPWVGQDAVLFLNRFSTILEAYRSGAMQYGCLIAEKPIAGR